MKFILFLCLAFATVPASAQLMKPGFMLGGNLHYNKPTGSFANTHQYGLGAEATGGIGLGKTYVTVTAGIASFQAHEKSVGNITYTPLKFGVRQYLINRNVFVQGDLGVGKVKQSGQSHSQFIRGIGVGARFLGVEGGVYYDGYKHPYQKGFANHIMFKVGSSFVF